VHVSKSEVQKRSVEPPASHSIFSAAFSLGVKRLELEANYSVPSRVLIKNERSITSFIPRCLHGVGRGSFFYFSTLPEGLDSSVGIETRYGLKGPGIESADPGGRAV
jgi:hypothetical protein